MVSPSAPGARLLKVALYDMFPAYLCLLEILPSTGIVVCVVGLPFYIIIYYARKRFYFCVDLGFSSSVDPAGPYVYFSFFSRYGVNLLLWPFRQSISLRSPDFSRAYLK